MKSSTNSKLNEISLGASVYVDSNIFIYDATGHIKYSAACKDFLKRIEKGELQGITSAITLSEVLQKLILIEVGERENIGIGQALRHIKQKPEILASLDKPIDAINKIEKIRNLRIVPLTNEIAASAKDYVKSTYLMSIDSVHVATMKAHGIKNIATNDSDFERVDFLKVWKP